MGKEAFLLYCEGWDLESSRGAQLVTPPAWHGQICAQEFSISKQSQVLDLQEERGILTCVFLTGSFQQKIIVSKKQFSWQTMLWHVYSHFAWFRWLFLFTSANALLLMLWGFCKVAELFCCWTAYLLSKYISPGFSSLQLGVFGLSTAEECRKGQREILCPATLFSSDHLWQARSHSRPHLFLCRGEIVHKEVAFRLLPQN